MSQTTSSSAQVPAGSSPATPPPRSLRGRVLRWIGTALICTAMALMLLWATLAVCFADTHSGPRRVTAVLYVLAAAAAILFLRPRRYGMAAFALLFLIALGWFFSRAPSNDRDWAPEAARSPWAEIDGDRVTVHNVRNFDYRTETDFTPRWENRRYDLATVETADLMLVHWGSPAVAHIMVSFGFADGRYLAVSIEARKERGEAASPIQAFFRQYELLYVIADERDVVRLRTNYRKGEDVYLYQTRLTPAQARKGLESYLHAANALHAKPLFYNALASNCATNVLEHARHGGMQGEFTMDIVLSGHAARQAYRNGHLDASIPFDELRRRSLVNAVARTADEAPDFSKRIRAGLPKPAKLAGGTSNAASPAGSRRVP